MQMYNPSIRLIISTIIFQIFFFCCQAVSADVVMQVKTDKDIYSAGETIRVNFTNASGSNRDWICIVAAGSRDNDAGDYKYMPGGLNQGVLTFDVPPPGKYEVRAYYNYSRNGYVVSARHGFLVEAKASSAGPVAATEVAKPAESSTVSSSSAGMEVIKPAESSPVNYSPAGNTQTSVAVFYFTPLSMEAAHYGITVTNALMNAPKMQSAFTMLSRKDLELFLEGNNFQQNEQADNMIEIGARLGVNFVIAGSIVKRGTMIVTNYKVVSIAQRKVICTNHFMSAGESDLISNVTKMSDAIIDAILRGAN